MGDGVLESSDVLAFARVYSREVEKLKLLKEIRMLRMSLDRTSYKSKEECKPRQEIATSTSFLAPLEVSVGKVKKSPTVHEVTTSFDMPLGSCRPWNRETRDLLENATDYTRKAIDDGVRMARKLKAKRMCNCGPDCAGLTLGNCPCNCTNKNLNWFERNVLHTQLHN